MNSAKKCVIIVNVGTPNSPSIWNVGKYLFQFLNDRRVIDIPFLLRFILVNCIIIPFRVRRTTKLYKSIWTSNGSPLHFISKLLKNKLQLFLGKEYKVVYAMRYQNPNLKKVLGELKKDNFNTITIFPLFPHYTSATSGTVVDTTFNIIRKWNVIPEIKTVPPFFNHPDFIKSIVTIAKNYNLNEYGHILFSFHSLPMKHLEKIHPNKEILNCECENICNKDYFYCYKFECFETARLIAKELNIQQDNYTVCFQSRLTKNWISPFTDDVLKEKADQGIKKVLLFSPSFVTDCLETVIELDQTYKDLFYDCGGERLDRVGCLNDNDFWVKALTNIAKL